jgi:hypothetical protein
MKYDTETIKRNINYGVSLGCNATSILEALYQCKITSTDVREAGLKYLITVEPGTRKVPSLVLGYTTDINKARQILSTFKNEILNDDAYRTKELRYDYPDWCKVRTVKRGTGEINTYDLMITDIPYVLENFELGKTGYVDRMPR